MSRVEPERNRYVGHRYVPKIFGEWDNQNDYEGLSIVTHQGTSYTSKKRVPVGIDILNEEFWVVTGNYNAQIEQYRQDVRNLEQSTADSLNTMDIKINTKADKTYTDLELSKKANKTYVDTELDKKTELISETVTVNIPTDFSTVQSAFNDILLKHITVPVIINIESGHSPILKTRLVGGDSSHITLTSDDSLITLSDSLEPLNTLFDLHNHHGFTFDIMVDMQGQGNHGIYLAKGSSIIVNEGKGITNAGNCGLYAREGSTAFAEKSVFTNAGRRSGTEAAGITAWGSTVNASGANVSGSATYGARAAHGGQLNFDNGNANNAGAHGIRATQNGIVTCRLATAQNAGTHGIYAFNTSTINARETNVTGAGGTGYKADSGSSIGAFLGVAEECETGVHATQGSTINFYSGKAERCGINGILADYSSTVEGRNAKLGEGANYGAVANENSIINIHASSIIRCTSGAIRSTNSSNINAASSNIVATGVGNTSAHGVVSDTGSRVNVYNANVINSGGDDLWINNGSTITANECNTTSSEGSNKPNIADCSPTAFSQMWSRGTIYAPTS